MRRSGGAARPVGHDDQIMCLLILRFLFGPRVALGLVWLFTNTVDRAFDGVLVPALGFLFLPWTTLAYAVTTSPGGPSAIVWVVIALGAIADLSSYGVSARTRVG